MTRQLNAAIRDIHLPERMRHRPISPEGYPVPWFARWDDDVKDIRVADTSKIMRAVRGNLCWTCGNTLGRHLAFCIGPMCSITRTISEPPNHRECAEFAARACPFLSKPRMRRNTVDLPDTAKVPAGIAIMRNPGVVIIWITRTFKVFRPHVGGGVLFKIGAPENVYAYREGRPATLAEVMESIDTGLHHLRESAEQDGPEAMRDLDKQITDARRLIEQRIAA